ncbi:hypothetical protein HAZT_HAZT007177 [Hyalella azteca]|uniref:Pre-mRNA-splicing regulator female-lethal(2)D n=1 Tax=Hyalella azteca TaxID=294128 RepID=A0A6A0GXA5_HYAAZ|nr:hypothetical protein HAZT_HAZT007177 [Hyalella azteca]
MQCVYEDADEGDLREAAERLKSQLAEAQRKEAYHIMRLSTKEHELQEMAGSVASSKSYSIARGSLLDPAVNLCIERLKRDLEAARSKTEEAQNELAAWKFTPDSNTGKQLMAKCRLLIKENEELGRAISSGKVAKLEGDITMQRECTEELKKSQSELDEFLMEVEEETEGMQGTILYLQQQLRSTKQQLQQLQAAQTTSINNNSTCNSPVVALSATPPMQHPAASSSATPLSPQRVATSSNTAASSASVMNETPAAVAELSANMNLESKVPMSPIKETLDPEIIPDIMESYTEIPTSRESAVKTSLHEDLVKKESSVKVECLIPSDARVPSPEKRGLDDVLSDVESMIIPHDEVLVAVDGQISNGQKRTRPNTDTESLDSTSNCEPVNEPMCKRTKITMLGDEDRSSESKPNGLPE